MAQTHFISKDGGAPGISATREPVLTIRPGAGERVTFETDDAAYRQMHEHHDMERVTAPLNPVTGPVRVEGAEPGDVLAVTVHDITFPGHGWSIYLPGAGALAGVMGEGWVTRRVEIDGDVVRLPRGRTAPLEPMIGCIGVAAADRELSTVMPAYPTGGNLDLNDAAPGSTVYLPVQVPGALLYIGDLHAIMGRGEATFVAIEAAGEATVSVDLVKSPGGSLGSLRAPRVETADEVICVGLGDPVQEAVVMAYESLFEVLTRDHGYSAADAYVTLSAVGHTELGGPTGSADPDPLHPFRAVGAVALARVGKEYLDGAEGRA